jgi:hypothetical protein
MMLGDREPSQGPSVVRPSPAVGAVSERDTGW